METTTHPQTHHSHTLDNIVGYRVRQTIRNGERLVGKELVVLASFEHPGHYMAALDEALTHRTVLYRTGPRGRRVLSESDADRPALIQLYRDHQDPYVRTVDYACVDNVYACGCVWGDDDYPADVVAAAPREGFWYLPTGTVR